MLKFKKIIILFLIALISLAGCTNNPFYNQTQSNAADVVERVQEARQISDDSKKPIPAVVVDKGLYVDKTPINLMKTPCWLKTQVLFRGDQLPFSYFSRTIASGAGRNVLTHFQVGLDPSVSVSMNYSGTVKGALDLLAAKTGFVYTVHGNDVYWQAFITRTFDIAFMPGAIDYQMGKSGGSSSGPTSSAMSAPGGTVVSSSLVDDSASQQYSSLKGSLSLWTDLQNTIGQLISKEGKVTVSQSTTTVTVRDRPSNVMLVAKYISNLNHNLSKQVLVKVQVLTVSLSSAYNYGINWDAVKKTLGGNQIVLQGNFGTPLTITPFSVTTPVAPLASPGNGLPQIGLVKNPNSQTGVTALISALNQQGKASIVTEPRVVCLNNQVSAIRILNQQGYVASIQNTTVAGASGSGSAGTITSQVTPGTVVTGLTLYILPKIMGDKVYLQVNADLSNLVTIQSLTTSAIAGAAAAQADGVPVIQAPQMTQQQFNQRSVIKSGATLILAGFRQVKNQANASQLFNSQALGGKAAQQNNDETIVLITPIILHGLG